MIESLIEDLDVIFISYDEPEKEKFWNELFQIYPFAKRVDGVKGFDAAHKRAAEISETSRFITIDGDTMVDPKFFDMELRYDEVYDKHVFSWASTNSVNGLVYGNGSLKCWPKDVALGMNTHEAADSATGAVEFCWDVPYLSLKQSFSTTYPASSPYHGFRAGFREGVKMALDQGELVEPPSLFSKVWRGNAQRLLTWMTLGADQPNGLWCIYGARLGLSMLNDRALDYNMIANYDWFPKFWESHIAEVFGTETPDDDDIQFEIRHLGRKIGTQTGYAVPTFDANQSRFVKMMREVPTETNDIKLLYNIGDD